MNFIDIEFYKPDPKKGDTAFKLKVRFNSPWFYAFNLSPFHERYFGITEKEVRKEEARHAIESFCATVRRELYDALPDELK